MLLSDISGFTALTEALTKAFGPQRGAEELTRHLNRVYDALISQVLHYAGSVVGFAGDAITVWFQRDDGRRAVAAALAMQQAMQEFSSFATPTGDRDGEMLASRGLGWSLGQSGNAELALSYCAQALEIAQELSSEKEQAIVLNYLGHARMALGQWVEAEQAYHQCLDQALQAQATEAELELRAASARVYLARGDTGAAMEQVEAILPHLHPHEVAGADEPLRVCLTCGQVLQAVQDPRAQEVLDQARHLLREQAERIPDEKERRAFLENVPWHRAIHFS